MTKVLVTGAAGFLGSRVVRHLVARGDQVFAVVRPGASLARLEAAGDAIGFISADLADIQPGAIDKIGPDVAIHLAWFTRPGAYLHAGAENLQSLEATVRLMRLLGQSGCPRLVLAGSCLEGLPQAPPSIYAACKRTAHRLAEELGHSGLSAVCAHIFYLYGPGEDHRRIIPLVIRKLLGGEEVAVTPGEQQRDYLHVADAAAALCALAGSALTGGVDVCSGSPVALREIFDSIGRETGRAELIKIGEVPYGDNEVFSAVGDPGALKQTGWRPSKTIGDGIKETVAWWAQREGAQQPKGWAV